MASIPRKPSLSLLLALMDLIDMEGGNGFESMPNLDRAGLKHVLLAYENFMTFYILQSALTLNGKRVVPVVTQYSKKHNLFYADSRRSMVGKYTVIMSNTTPSAGKSYFVQEVLGPLSLKLLTEVTCDKYEFWDMALEVPTHRTALTPAFQLIQPSQLLLQDKGNNNCTGFDKTPSDDTPPSDSLALEKPEIEPMLPTCCVAPTEKTRMRSSSQDNFTKDGIVCKLNNFICDSGKPTVYLRRSSRSVVGKRVNLTAVVAPRKGQTQSVLFISTTLRFCRAVKRCCVKGNGELVSCWNDTLKELERPSFLTGLDMHQEVQRPALAAFIKRVNPNSWYNYIPKHVESLLDLTMLEVVELAVKLMEDKIPSAFAVAELFYCPLEKLKQCVKFWTSCASDESFYSNVVKKRVLLMEAQMATEWENLMRLVTAMQRRSQEDDTYTAKSEAVFKACTVDNLNKVQKKWFSKDREEEDNKAKVVFLKLRTYHAKLNKLKKKVGKGDSEHEAEVSASPRQAQGSGETQSLNEREASDSRYIIAPDQTPLASWLRNMTTLLVSGPWLNNSPSGDMRRNGVCTLLGLDETLLAEKNNSVLCEWVVANRNIVAILMKYDLKDRLSKGLIECMRSLSVDTWKQKITDSFSLIKLQIIARGQ